MPDTEDESFDTWYNLNELTFYHGQYTEKDIAYSAFMAGVRYAKTCQEMQE